MFSARQQSMDRPVAIKVLKPRAARLKSSRQAFVSEAVITGCLDHPNIVPIYDVGKQADDALFYAMKQVEGVEWKERLATNSVDENLEILLRVSDAVAFAHARCIIHRDLKPANIMLGGFGEVLVMDWGLAMPSHDHPRRNSFPRAKRGGTPHYMAPEMADDPMLGVDRRSDVYLLGAILFEIVTGKPPHAIESAAGSRRERVKACLAAVAQNQIAETDATGELIDIARTAMATNPADRYQTVQQFQSAVRDYLAHQESIELTDQSTKLLNSARGGGDYKEFSRAQFGFETALEQWPENARALKGLKDTRQTYARTAFDRGDYDLALSLLDSGMSDEAEFVATVQAASTERDSRANRIQRLRRFSFAASLTVAVLAAVAALWINSERNKALIAQQDEATQRGIAERKEREAQKQRQAAVEAQGIALENERRAKVAESLTREEKEISDSVVEYLAELLAQAAPENQPDRDLTVREIMERAAGEVEERFSDHPRVEALIQAVIGESLVSLSEGTKAEPHLVKALELQRKHLGEEHATTLRTMRELGRCYVFLEKHAESERLLESALDLARRQNGDGHAETLDAIFLLATLRSQQLRLSEADSLIDELLTGTRSSLGEKHPRTLQAKRMKAEIHMMQRQYGKAEPLLLEVLADTEEVFGKRHPSRVNTLSSLGALYSAQEKYGLAEEKSLEALRISREVMGEEHLLTLITMLELAETYFEQGKLNQARPLIKRIEEIAKRTVGLDHRALTGFGFLKTMIFVGDFFGIDESAPAPETGKQRFIPLYDFSNPPAPDTPAPDPVDSPAAPTRE